MTTDELLQNLRDDLNKILNDFIDNNKYAKVTVVGYQVVQISPYGRDATYILAEVEE